MAEKNVNIGGGFFSLLTVLFIGLKLTGHIDWSWFWVLSPIIFPVLLVILLILVVVILKSFDFDI